MVRNDMTPAPDLDTPDLRACISNQPPADASTAWKATLQEPLLAGRYTGDRSLAVHAIRFCTEAVHQLTSEASADTDSWTQSQPQTRKAPSHPTILE